MQNFKVYKVRFKLPVCISVSPVQSLDDGACHKRNLVEAGETMCMIKIFRGAGVVTPSKPPPPSTNNFCLYPPPVLRCFWKDPLMTPTPPPHFKHVSLQPPTPSTTPSPPKNFDHTLFDSASPGPQAAYLWVPVQCVGPKVS